MDINIFQQFRNFRKVILYLLLALIFFLLLVYVIRYVYSLPLEILLEDPASLYGYNQFAGFITFIGIIILSIGIGAVMLVVFILAPSLRQKEKAARKTLIAISILALISLFFILDDLFLLHERVFTGLLHVGERRIFLIYGILFAAVLFAFLKQILSGPIIFLIFAGLLFAVSLGIDFLSDKVMLSDAIIPNIKMLEEGCKLGGYIFWTAFIVWRSKALLEIGSVR